MREREREKEREREIEREREQLISQSLVIPPNGKGSRLKVQYPS